MEVSSSPCCDATGEVDGYGEAKAREIDGGRSSGGKELGDARLQWKERGEVRCARKGVKRGSASAFIDSGEEGEAVTEEEWPSMAVTAGRS